MNISRDRHEIFYLEGFEINPKTRMCRRQRDNRLFTLTPQQYQGLLLLLENIGVLVKYEQFKSELWNEVSVDERHGSRQIVNRLRSIFGKEKIETVTDKGYRYVGEPPSVIKESGETQNQDSLEGSQETDTANKVEFDDAEDQAEVTSEAVDEKPDDFPPASNASSEKVIQFPKLVNPFGGHALFVMSMGFLYAAVPVVSLYLETAYLFEKFINEIFKLSIFTFFLAYFFNCGYFWLIHFLYVRKNSSWGIISGVFLAITGTSILFVLGALVLPSYPVTQAKIQTQPALSAHLKNLFFYLLPIYLATAIVPYGSIISWKQELNRGKHADVKKALRGRSPNTRLLSRLNFSPSIMIILLLLIFIGSTIGAHNLLDTLLPGENQNLFSNLLWTRNGLLFAIGVLGIYWYFENRKEIELVARIKEADQGPVS